MCLKLRMNNLLIPGFNHWKTWEGRGGYKPPVLFFCKGMGRGGEVVYGVCRIIFFVFSKSIFKKDFKVIIGLKLKIRIMSLVQQCYNTIINKGCLVTFNKSCLKRLKLKKKKSQKLFPSIWRSYLAYKIQNKNYI